MDEKYLEDLAGKPLGTRVRGYMKLAGPGYLQSAMTLGGGSIAGSVTTASLLGYELLWVSPMAILLGYFVLAAIGKMVTNSGEKPYATFWKRLHPAMAILWGGSALIATILWHIPQYGLTANGLIVLGEGLGVDLDTKVLRAVMGAACLGAACFVLSLYGRGVRGLKLYETVVKVLVWSIVLAFAIVCFSTGIDLRRFLLGITGISFLQNYVFAGGIPETAIKPIVGSIAAAVGINMVFLYPYSILNKGWGKPHKELAYYDLLSGMVLPFLIATSLMMLAVANTIGPAEGEIGTAVRDMREIIPVLEGTIGANLGAFLVGLGMFAVGFSTIITHMLASGFIGCELFGFDYKSRAKLWFSLLPAVGVVGVMIQFPWAAAVTASSLAMPLLPVTVIGFIILLNSRSFMGDAMPRGGYRFIWNFFLIASVCITGVSSFFALQKNWEDFSDRYLKNSEETAAPAEETGEAGDEAAAQQQYAKHVSSADAMGTVFTITLYGEADQWGQEELRAAAEEAFLQVHSLERRISSWQANSVTSEINRKAADEPVYVDDDTLALLLVSKRIHAETDGAFDVTVGPLVELWGFYRREGRLPEAAELEAARSLVNLDYVLVDEAAGTVAFDKPGVRLDFGGIGKGLALDKAAEALRTKGIKNALLDSGSSTVLAMGAPPGRDAWQIGVKNPQQDNVADALADVALRDMAFSTSAGYENFLEVDGKRYGHIFDPGTGMPVDGILSATAIAPEAILADALSTAFFVLGEAGTRAYCAEHPDTRAILVLGEPESPQVVRINFA